MLHLRSDQKVFCAGADLKEVRERFDAADGPDRMYAYVAGIQRLYARIEQLPQVTLAEIGGAAMGGGLELALACDLRIAALEAKLGLPEARLGLIPGAGGTQRLTRLCGRSAASRLILGAEVIDGADRARSRRRAMGGAARRARAARRRARRAASPSFPAAALARQQSLHRRGGRAGRPAAISLELEATRRLSDRSGNAERVAAFLAGASMTRRGQSKGAQPCISTARRH